MKKIILFIFLLMPALAFAHIISISGKVLDKQSQETLPGAVITIPELKLSVVSDQEGRFTFNDIPGKGKFLVEVRYIGYQTLVRTVDLYSTEEITFELSPSLIEAKEVVVTGTANSTDNRRNSTSVSAVTKDGLLNRPGTNLIDALAKVPGVSQITTGGGISKPVIRGLSSNRILTLVDGARQEGQQWGDEHGIEVDQFGADRVEILRGAASLIYGSDALGGVINILDPLPVPQGVVQGELLSSYNFNNGLSGSSAMIQGNNRGFIWRARGSYKNAFSYNAPGGRIANTGFDENNYSAQLGLNKKWGYSHLSLSSFNSKVGLPDFERNEDGYFEDADGRVLTDSDLRDRSLFLPFQDIRHYKIALNSHILTGNGRLRTTFAFQDNQRREMEEDRSEPALFFDLKTYSGDLKYFFNEKRGWEPAIGLSGSFQKNRNKAEELLIPDYQMNELGFFAFAKKNWSHSTFNIGLRFDHRNIRGDDMADGTELKFENFRNSYSNVSGAIGYTKEFSETLNFKSNLGSAFRSPNIAELASNGVHEGTFRYEVGNSQLKPEKSLYADFAFELHNNVVSASLGAFNNYINDYIFSRHLNAEFVDVEGEEFPLYRFVQANANLSGIEANVAIHPLEILHIENTFSFTRGVNRETKKPLPFIPAAVVRNEIKVEPQIKNLRSSYFSVGFDNVFRQNRVDDFERSTGAYTLLNLSMGSTLHLNAQEIRLSLAVNNLFDKAYYDHLSRFKPGRLDPTDNSVGYFNPGRSVSVGVYVPFR